jgi:hypothetical protein
MTTTRFPLSKLGSWLAALGCAACLFLTSGPAEAGGRPGGGVAAPRVARGEPGGITGPIIQRRVRGARWQRTKALAYTHMTPGRRVRTEVALHSRNAFVRGRAVRRILRNAYVGPR